MRRIPTDKPRPDLDTKDRERIDELYGLEPVFEPGAREAGETAAVGIGIQSVQCPYCGETFETSVDLSAGSSSYVEDCQICCQPIEFALHVDEAGELVSLSAARGD
jgi:hypothetical protein